MVSVCFVVHLLFILGEISHIRVLVWKYVYWVSIRNEVAYVEK